MPDTRPRMEILSDIRLSMVILARYKAKEGNPILDIRSRMSILTRYKAQGGNPPDKCTGHAFYARYKAHDGNPSTMKGLEG